MSDDVDIREFEVTPTAWEKLRAQIDAANARIRQWEQDTGRCYSCKELQDGCVCCSVCHYPQAACDCCPGCGIPRDAGCECCPNCRCYDCQCCSRCHQPDCMCSELGLDDEEADPRALAAFLAGVPHEQFDEDAQDDDWECEDEED